jgi:hypothetical protein
MTLPEDALAISLLCAVRPLPRLHFLPLRKPLTILRGHASKDDAGLPGIEDRHDPSHSSMSVALQTEL